MCKTIQEVNDNLRLVVVSYRETSAILFSKLFSGKEFVSSILKRLCVIII